LQDVSTRWAVSHDIAQWQEEIAWMSLYFSLAVWASLGLCGFGLVKEHLPHYRRPRRVQSRVGALAADYAMRGRPTRPTI
jgi:hypothetical protein